MPTRISLVPVFLMGDLNSSFDVITGFKLFRKLILAAKLHNRSATAHEPHLCSHVLEDDKLLGFLSGSADAFFASLLVERPPPLRARQSCGEAKHAILVAHSKLQPDPDIKPIVFRDHGVLL